MPKQSRPHLDRQERVQVNAHIDPVLARRLRVKLALEGITYRDWLEARIREYAHRVRLPRQDREA